MLRDASDRNRYAVNTYLYIISSSMLKPIHSPKFVKFRLWGIPGVWEECQALPTQRDRPVLPPVGSLTRGCSVLPPGVHCSFPISEQSLRQAVLSPVGSFARGCSVLLPGIHCSFPISEQSLRQAVLPPVGSFARGCSVLLPGIHCSFPISERSLYVKRCW